MGLSDSKSLREGNASSLSLSFYHIYFFLFFFFLFSFFRKAELSSHFFSGWLLVCMEHVARFAPSSPTLELLCKNQVCGVRFFFEHVPLPESTIIYTWYNSSCPHASYVSFGLLGLILKGLATKNTWRYILTWQHDLAFIKKESLFVYYFYMIVRGISW
jgi:hypothetical protein